MSADQAQETYKRRSGSGVGPHGLGKIYFSLNIITKNSVPKIP